MKVADALAQVRFLFIDTAPIIYHVENVQPYRALTNIIFGAIRVGLPQAATSSITLAECLVECYRSGDMELADRFRRAITSGPNLLYVGVDTTVERAAELRARYNLALTDAFQVAAALATGCDAILTNDQDLKRVTEIKVVMLRDLEP